MRFVVFGNSERNGNEIEIAFLATVPPVGFAVYDARPTRNLSELPNEIFVSDTLNPMEFDNFPFVESWVNTACPRFADEKKGVVNYELVEKSL